MRPLPARPRDAKAISGWSCSVAAHVFVLLCFAWHVPIVSEPPALVGTSNVLNIEAAADPCEEASVARSEVVIQQSPSRELSPAVATPQRRTADPPPLRGDPTYAETAKNVAVLPVSAAAPRIASPPLATAVRVPLLITRRPLAATATLAATGAAAVEHWRFRPARRGHQSVSSSVLLPIVFELPARSGVSASPTRLSN